MAKGIGPTGFAARWALALVLVLGTYNPTGLSFVGWAFGEGGGFSPPVLIVGLILLIGWIFVVKTTFDAIGWLGVILGGALFAAIVWWFIDIGWLSLESRGILTWIVLVVISLILAAGMSWSYFKRSLTGQINVDDVDD
ncbi:MAG: DUF6524 family protein [Xanthomonadales bacterium]|jgi:hypothetical protein|nr:DUF6524 family protein [Xanthomonadales bacterium]